MSLQMAVSPAPASQAQSAPASETAHSSVAGVHPATQGTASRAKTSTNAKRSPMLAILITESTVVKTRSRVTTVFPVPRVSLVLSRLEEVWQRQLLKNRFGLLLKSVLFLLLLMPGSLAACMFFNHL